MKSNDTDDDDDDNEEGGGGGGEEETKLISEIQSSSHTNNKFNKTKTTTRKLSNTSKKSVKWNWKKDFMKIITNMAGLRKLTSIRPSTAAIGNWGILQVVSKISEWKGKKVIVLLLLLMLLAMFVSDSCFCRF